MRLRNSLGTTALLGLAVCAGVPGTASAQGTTRSAFDVITVTGCVEKETVYRARVADGRGGTLGSGAGAANEYVLRSVTAVSSDTLKPTGTTSREYEEVYSVTGDLERELDKALGNQIAMSGYVEVAKSDGTSKLKDLPSFKAIGWHTVKVGCPADTRKR